MVLFCTLLLPITGAEYAVTSTGERVHSAKSYVTRVKSQAHEAEESLRILESKIIEKTRREDEAQEQEEEAETSESQETNSEQQNADIV